MINSSHLIRAWHDRAMALADAAFLARRRDHDEAGALALTRQALVLETAAAEAFKTELTAEPTRSILYRSAASLAWQCGELGQARTLIASGLAGRPPAEIAQELRELLVLVRARCFPC